VRPHAERPRVERRIHVVVEFRPAREQVPERRPEHDADSIRSGGRPRVSILERFFEFKFRIRIVRERRIDDGSRE